MGERRDYNVQMCECVQFTYCMVYFSSPVASKILKFM